MKLFVTGGTGYIGEYVLQEALADGHDVYVLTRSKQKADALKARGVRAFVGDFLQDGEWQGAFQRADAIIHLAAPPTWGEKVTKKVAQTYATGHLQLTERLFELAEFATCKKIIFVGGTSFFGDTGNEALRDEAYRSDPKGWGPYIAPSIHYAEKMKAKFPVSIVFPAQIYGPSSWMEQLYLQPLQDEKPLTSLKGYRPMINPIHIEDCARAFIHLIEHGQAGEDYLVVDGQPVDSFSYREEIERHLGKQAVKIRLVPKWLCQIAIGPVLTEYATAHTYFTNKKLVATGFTYRYPSYKEGLPQVVATWKEKKGIV